MKKHNCTCQKHDEDVGLKSLFKELFSQVPPMFVVAWFTGAVVTLALGALVIAALVRYLVS